jgi:SAM-dependent methyltransferase
MKTLIRFLLNYIPRPWLIRMSLWVMQLIALFYRGNKVACPVCDGHFRKFLPYGYYRSRENALCPRCFSLERHRLLWIFLQQNTNFFKKPQKVLHIAPEQCFHKRFRALKHLNYVTADLESPLADIKLDVQHMPFADKEFDVVICNHVLEHVPDDQLAIKEVFRVLKSGGYAILQVPIVFSMESTYEDPSITDPAGRLKHFKQKDHYRIYGSDFLNRITGAGFEIREGNFLNRLKPNEKMKYCLPEKEFMYGYFKP